MLRLSYSRVLKVNTEEKWVKYIISKNIEKSRSSYHLQWGLTYHLQRSSLACNSLPSLFHYMFFLWDIWLYHINKDIFEVPLQAVCFRIKSNNCFFSYSYFISARCVKFFPIQFFFLFTKKSCKKNIFRFTPNVKT